MDGGLWDLDFDDENEVEDKKTDILKQVKNADNIIADNAGKEDDNKNTNIINVAKEVVVGAQNILEGKDDKGKIIDLQNKTEQLKQQGQNQVEDEEEDGDLFGGFDEMGPANDQGGAIDAVPKENAPEENPKSTAFRDQVRAELSGMNGEMGFAVNKKLKAKRGTKKRKRGFFSGIARFLGNVIGIGITAVGIVAGGVYGIGRAIFGKSVKAKQKSNDTNGIGGKLTEGMNLKFEEFGDLSETGDENQDIYSDTRRPPLVWEKPIPEKTDVPPEIEIDINRVQEGGRKSVEDGYDDMKNNSHASVALYYTRTSRQTGKTERYMVRVGFYRRGGFDKGALTASQLTGTFVPATIRDNSDLHTVIGKRYRTTNKNINKVIKAMPEYVSGGYQMFKRNCSTFVMDMLKVAGINDNSLEETSSTVNAGIWLGGSAVSGIAGLVGSQKYKDETLKPKFGKVDDSYLRFGQQQITGDEFKNAGGNDIFMSMSGYSPNALISQIREGNGMLITSNLRDEKTGNIKGFNNLDKNIGIKNPNLSDDDLPALDTYVAKLADAVLKISEQEAGKGKSKDAVYLAAQSPEYSEMMAYLGDVAKKFKTTVWFGLAEDKKIALIKEMTALLGDARAMLSSWYLSKAGHDDRIYNQVMNIVAIIQAETDFLYKEYAGVQGRHRFDENDALGAMKQEFMTYNDVNVGKELEGVKRTYRMNRAKLLGLIQVYGSAQAGIDNFVEFKMLSKIKKEDRDYQQDARYRTLFRQMSTVDDFEKSFQYYLSEKSDFTAEDANMAFVNMPQKEAGADLTNGVVNPNTARNFLPPSEMMQIMAMQRANPNLSEILMDNYDKIIGLDKEADNLPDAEGILYTAFLNALNEPGMKLVIEAAFNMPENGYASFDGNTPADKIARLVFDRWFRYAYEVIRSIRGEKLFNIAWLKSMRDRIRSGDDFDDMTDAVKSLHSQAAEAA